MTTVILRHHARVAAWLTLILLCLPQMVRAGEGGLSSLGGYVYIDRNNDGLIAFNNEALPELVLGGVTISLFDLGGTAESLVATTVTDSLGRYQFSNLLAGTYAIRQSQPIEYIDGIETLGMILGLSGPPAPPGSFPGMVEDNHFTGIVLTDRATGQMYNFGERGLAPGFVSKRYLLGTAPQPDPVGTGVTITDPTGNSSVPEPSGGLLVLLAAPLLATRRR